MAVPKPSPVGQNLRRLRIGAGLTQAQLAEAADVTDATISRIERGRFSPSQALLLRLADAVGGSAGELVARGRKAKKPALMPSEARLLALVRNMDDAQVDDIAKALKLIIAAARRGDGPAKKPTARGRSRKQ